MTTSCQLRFSTLIVAAASLASALVGRGRSPGLARPEAHALRPKISAHEVAARIAKRILPPRRPPFHPYDKPGGASRQQRWAPATAPYSAAACQAWRSLR